MNLYPHQQHLLNINPKKWAMVWGMGTGKTIGSLALADRNCQSILIICPKGLRDNWENNVKSFKWSNNKKVTVYTKEYFRKWYKSIPKYDCVIVDECHHFLGMKSAMMKSLRSYFKIHQTEYRYFLSGTVYRSSPFDVFILSNLMGKPIDYYRFFNRFFYNVSMGNRLVPMVKKGIENDIAKIVQSLGNTVKLEDCIDMPEQTFDIEYFDLTKEQKKEINDLEDIIPIVRYTKIHQICGGSLKGDEYVKDKIIPSLKTERLVELCYELDRVIIVCRYNNEILALYNRLREEFPDRMIEYINGSVDDRQNILDRMNLQKKYILLVNAKCSEGWQLQTCSYMIFYSYDFEFKNKIQMEARLTRIDAPRPTFYLSLITKGTIDEDVYSALDKHLDFHLAIYEKERNL